MNIELTKFELLAENLTPRGKIQVPRLQKLDAAVLVSKSLYFTNSRKLEK